MTRRFYLYTLAATSIGTVKVLRTMTIKMEPYTEGMTDMIATLAEEIEDVEHFFGKPNKLVKIWANLWSFLEEFDRVVEGVLVSLRGSRLIVGTISFVGHHCLSVDSTGKPIWRKTMSRCLRRG